MKRLIAVSVVALAACSGKEKANDSATTARADSAAAATAAASGGVPADLPNDPSAATVMRVTLTGGPSAGTYTAKSTERTCSVGGTQGDDVWANSFADMNAQSGLSVFQLTTTPVQRTSGKGQTDKFSVAFSIGNPMSSKDYTIDSKSAKATGSGTLTLNDTGSNAVLTIKGTTAAGVGVDAVIVCNQVRRGR